MADIECRYLCDCMVEEAVILVPARRAHQDIVDWVQLDVTAVLYLDHRRRSPSCRRAAVTFVKIPAPENAPYIGAAPKLDS